MYYSNSFLQLYLINPPEALDIKNVAKVLKAGQNKEQYVAELTVNYYAANSDATGFYVKVSPNNIIKKPL